MVDDQKVKVPHAKVRSLIEVLNKIEAKLEATVDNLKAECRNGFY